MKIYVIICLFISSITSNAQEVFVNSQASKNEANFFPNPTAFVAQETITIPDGIQSITKDERTGLVTVTDTKGVKHDLPQGKDVAVADENGRGALVDKQGQITNTTAEQAKAAGKREYGFSVVFEKATESKAGFDKYDGKTTALKNTYQKIEEYIVPWKAVGTGTDVVKGNLNFGTARDLLFEQEGARLTYNEFTNILTINPVPAGSTAQVIVKEKVGGKEKIRGKLNVAGYASMSKTVHLIPVNNATCTISEADLKTYLDDVYGQALVSWQVDIKNKIEVPFTGDFEDGGSGLLSTYTGDMRKVIKAYGSMEQEQYYIFLIDRGKTKTGYMPRGKRAGFVFLNSQNGEELKHTIAHELGHGAFTLRHPFAEYPTVTEKSTDNLMDYAGGNHLYKWQWDQIHNPVLVLGLFEGDSEGEYSNLAHFALTPSGNVADEFFTRKNGQEQQIDVTAILSNSSYCIEVISYESERYEWDAVSKTYKNGGKSIYFKKKAKPLEDKVNLFKPVGDGCQYYYALIKWTDADAASQNTAQTIASKITSKTQWVAYPYSLQKPGCVEQFLKDVDNSSKQCNREDIDKSDQLLQQNMSVVDGAKLADVINSSCLASLRKLSYEQQISFFKKIAAQASVRDRSEIALIRLMNAMNTESYAAFYTDLERNNNELIKHLVAEMADAFTYPWGDNYTNFIGALVIMFKIKPEVCFEKFAEVGNEKLLSQVINLNPQPFKNDYVSTISWGVTRLNEFKFEGRYNAQAGTVTIKQLQRATHIVGDKSAENWGPFADFAEGLSPLTPIVITTANDLPIVQTALDADSQSVGVEYIVPAIFLKYKGDKEFNDKAIKATMIALDVATIAASGGIALTTKITWARRLWALTEVAGAVGNIGVNLNVIDTTTNYGKAVNYYNMAMGAIGITHAGRGLVHFTKNLPGATKTLVREKGNIRAILLSNYLKWKIATTNLEGLTDAERQLITKQGQVWTMLGLADEGVSVARAFKEITTNVRTALRNRINHITKIVFEQKGKGYKFTGCHSKSAIDELGANARIEITVPANAEGVYEAKVFAKDPSGIERMKSGNEGKSTFFPDNWDEAKIIDEVEYAVRNNRGFANYTDTKDGYYGFSKNGKIKIEFFYNETTGSINSFFPSLRP